MLREALPSFRRSRLRGTGYVTRGTWLEFPRFCIKYSIYDIRFSGLIVLIFQVLSQPMMLEWIISCIEQQQSRDMVEIATNCQRTFLLSGLGIDSLLSGTYFRLHIPWQNCRSILETLPVA